jgi:hypothetical protein
MEKVTTKDGKVVYFGIQTPKGTTYFGEEASQLTHFMRNKSVEIVSIDGKVIPIYSEEHPAPGSFTYYLDDGRVLVIRPSLNANGYHVAEAFFDRNWK